MQRPILMDIFEPPPQWMHSQPSSLSDIVYQDLNNLSLHEDDIPKRYQSDNNSLATSIYTAEEENTRHGHLPSIETPQEDMVEYIHTKMKDLNIEHTLSWEDYRPQYKILNASYDDMKLDIYSDIYATLKKMQALDQKFNLIKAGFYFNMEKEHEAMSMRLLSQCEELSQQKEHQSKHTSLDQDIQSKESHEKVKLNVGGSLFETSLGTLRRDTHSLLAIMFSGRHLISAEADESYFIDRDPSHFRLVLNYLRDLRVPPTILKDITLRQELLQEAKYYCIEGLVQLLQ